MSIKKIPKLKQPHILKKPRRSQMGMNGIKAYHKKTKMKQPWVLEIYGTLMQQYQQMNVKDLQSDFQRNINEERTVSKKHIPDHLLVDSQYEIMTTWILEHLDQIGCHHSTKYLAKTYLDRYLSQQTGVVSEDLHLIAITVSRLAFKSQQYPINFAEKVGNYRYLAEEFRKMENEVLTVLDFNLNYVTPYHYLHVISELIGFKDDLVGEITQMIDFSSTLKQLATISAGEMLMSILLYLAYSYDPEKIQIIKRYGSAFPNLCNVVLLLNQKATEADQGEMLE